VATQDATAEKFVFVIANSSPVPSCNFCKISNSATTPRWESQGKEGLGEGSVNRERLPRLLVIKFGFHQLQKNTKLESTQTRDGEGKHCGKDKGCFHQSLL
jgi:hypothetical protein